MTTGNKIQNLRKTQNITQEQLAEYLGVSRQSVSKWESNAAYPETDKMIKMGSLFHVSLDYLLREDYETAEELAKKNDLAKFNTHAFVLSLLSIFGYIFGVSLVYITQKNLIGFIVLIGFIFASAILYIFRRSHFLLHSDFFDLDQRAIMRNTRMIYSIDLIMIFLFLPLLIFTQSQSIGWFGPIQLTFIGVLKFSAYFWVAIFFGLIGTFVAFLVRFFHQKYLLHTQSRQKTLPIVIFDSITSFIGVLLFLTLFFFIDLAPPSDFYQAVIFLLFFPYLVIFPLVFLKVKTIPVSLLIKIVFSALVFIFSFMLFQSAFYALGLLLSALNLVIFLCMALKSFINAIRNREVTQSILIKNGILLLLVEGLINAFTYFYTIPNQETDFYILPNHEADFGEFLSLGVISFVIIFGFYFGDRLIIKKTSVLDRTHSETETV